MPEPSPTAVFLLCGESGSGKSHWATESGPWSKDAVYKVLAGAAIIVRMAFYDEATERVLD